MTDAAARGNYGDSGGGGGTRGGQDGMEVELLSPRTFESGPGPVSPR